MQKYISFLTLTEKGQEVPPAKIHEVYTQMLGITESFGGKTLEIYTAGGDFDFVAISEFPSEEAAFKARVKLNQLGFARLEGGPTFSIETFLSAASEQRVPAAV
jgi:uncharacterized protein with GYD domain